MALVSNIKIEEDIITFDLNNKSNKINNSFANAIRRIIISNVETYIIDDTNTTVYDNGTLLDKEQLKLRLMLIPIISNIPNLNYENIIITCNIYNEDDNIKSIYVKDFICKDRITNKIIDTNILFKYPKILFAKIKNNETLSFEGHLIKNNSEKGGAYFNPVSKCVYTFKVDDNRVKEITKNMTKEEISNFKTQDIERVFQKNSNNNPNTYQFSIESIGFYDPKSIVLYAIDELIKKLNIIKEDFLHLESNAKIIFLENGTNPDFFNFSIDDENDTIGNLLSTYICGYQNVIYSGYLIEHPLKKNIILRIKLDKNNNKENVIKVIIENIDIINNLLDLMKKDLLI